MTQTTINPIVLQGTVSTMANDQTVAVLRKPSGQEVETVDNIRKSINIEDTSSTIKYGTQAQSDISQFTDIVLQNVKSKDVGGTAKDLEAMIDEMNSIDFDSIKKSDGFLARLPVLGYWMKKGIKNFVGDFDTIQGKLKELLTTMNNQESLLIKDIQMFDGFYAQTIQFVRNLELFIIAGEEKLVELHQEVSDLKKQAEETRDPLDAQRYSDRFKAVDRFEKRLNNLKISRIASINSSTHIRIAQEADKMIVDDINDIIHNTIPLWKNQFVIAVSLMNSEKALKINKTVKDYTNKQYVENAKKLNGVVSMLSEEYSRGILDIASLQEVNKLTIETVQKSLSIHKEASVKRKEAEKQLAIMEDDIKKALIDASSKGGL
jgi:uncharacterized protein YaaN involved in tellurite resistance